MHFLDRLANRLTWRRFFGVNGLDRRLVERLGYKRNGFFIEAGANDGIAQSNTLYFEKYLGWHGLLVEPIVALAALCRQNRPGALVENAALVPFGFSGDTVELRYCNLMSVVKGSLRTIEEEERHIEAGCRVQKIESYDVVATARTLQSILDTHGIVEADLFVLDVEGFEAKVLAGIDFNRFVAHNLLVEARYREEVDAVLGGRYRVVEQISHHDVLYSAVR